MTDKATEWVRFEWPLAGREFDLSVTEGYRLRPAEVADVDAMVALVGAAYESDPAWDGFVAKIQQRVGGRIRDRISDPGAHFVVVECDDGVVGLNGVALESPTNMHLITGICVAPAHQGRGLGAALLGRSLAWLRNQGLSSATVTTDAGAVAARVYDRFGAARTDHAKYSLD